MIKGKQKDIKTTPKSEYLLYLFNKIYYKKQKFAKPWITITLLIRYEKNVKEILPTDTK